MVAEWMGTHHERGRGSRDPGQHVEDLLVLRESAELFLGKDEGVVVGYLEHPAARFDKLRLELELILDRVRQTGGSRIVVSLYTVLDGYAHGASWSSVFRNDRSQMFQKHRCR